MWFAAVFCTTRSFVFTFGACLQIGKPARPEHGELALPCFALAKQLNIKNPAQVATDLCALLTKKLNSADSAVSKNFGAHHCDQCRLPCPECSLAAACARRLDR